ncbi:secreted RxLR effector protein 161-like [Apium graveolens]|uniref:secreted RxLR effector protein 161-like n=1 Tax=Apium graveolens TaxID=4045 RepID=UPI003D7A138C
MGDCNPTKYPMDPKEQIGHDEKGRPVDASQYISMVGGLRYVVHTRPDIAYSVGIVNRYMERPTKLHLDAVKRIMRYVKGTTQYGLVYSKDSGNNILTGFSDSDLDGHLDDRKSTSGMVFYLNKSAITRVSQKQKCVALSSCEAEFMAATAAAFQGIWLCNILSQITSETVGPVILCIDNHSAIDLAKNPMFHGKSKHIDIRYHFIRECVERGEVQLKHVCSSDQRADILTKGLATIKFERMRNLLGVKNLGRHI